MGESGTGAGFGRMAGNGNGFNALLTNFGMTKVVVLFDTVSLLSEREWKTKRSLSESRSSNLVVSSECVPGVVFSVVFFFVRDDAHAMGSLMGWDGMGWDDIWM
jgi:hypothetical protein